MKQKIEIFTDGSCLGNPGPGGYGALIRYGVHIKELSTGYFLTTNNRMELLATIMALTCLTRPCQVHLTLDSQYVCQGITKWIYIWKKKGWKNSARQPVCNADLWQRLDQVCYQHHVVWQWVQGHQGHLENERCDYLARQAAMQPTLEDNGYIVTLPSQGK